KAVIDGARVAHVAENCAPAGMDQLVLSVERDPRAGHVPLALPRHSVRIRAGGALVKGGDARLAGAVSKGALVEGDPAEKPAGAGVGQEAAGTSLRQGVLAGPVSAGLVRSAVARGGTCGPPGFADVRGV